MSLIASCFGGPLLRHIVVGWWDGYKARHATDPVPMKRRRGRWQHAGFIQTVERGADWLSYLGLACIALGLVGAAYGAIK